MTTSCTAALVNAHLLGDPPPLIHALLNPAAFPHPATDIQMHETHISWVVLAGAHAYKIKKPVDFGFLDFSTRQQRDADNTREVTLNRRLCPDIYLGVVPVTMQGGFFAIGGAGVVQETAVHMRRLPDDGMLPSLLTRDQVPVAVVQRIARTLAHFHAHAATGDAVDAWGSPEAITANWEENFAETAPFVGEILLTDRVAAIRQYVETTLHGARAMFAERVATGHIRDGHGDLHAASICVEGRRIHLFDCLEFADRYRCADVAADVAFLAMDLDHFGRADLAQGFVDAYIAESGDDDLKDLLDFYRCYRAYVRCKVACLRIAEHGTDEATAIADARSYLDLAWAYAGGIPRPVLAVVMGLPATGKTTVATALAGRLGLIHLSSDRVRKERGHVALTTHQSTAFGQGMYDPAVTRRTYALLRRRAARYVRRGCPVVLDATYGTLNERAAVLRLARRLRVPLCVLVCQADDRTIMARLAARSLDPSVVSDARIDLWPALHAAFVEPDELPFRVIVQTAGPLDAVIGRAIRAISEARGGKAGSM